MLHRNRSTNRWTTIRKIRILYEMLAHNENDREREKERESEREKESVYIHCKMYQAISMVFSRRIEIRCEDLIWSSIQQNARRNETRSWISIKFVSIMCVFAPCNSRLLPIQDTDTLIHTANNWKEEKKTVLEQNRWTQTKTGEKCFPYRIQLSACWFWVVPCKARVFSL